MMKKTLFILILLIFSNSAFAKKEIVNIYDIPRKVPNRTIYHESGKRFLLTDFKGDFLLVVFWSKKCSVCIRELDDLNKFSNIVKKHGIKVIAVSPSGEWSDIQQTKDFLRKRKAPNLEVYWDEDGDLAADFGIYSTPHNVLINKKGEEVGRIRGRADWDDDDVIQYMYKLKAKHG